MASLRIFVALMLVVVAAVTAEPGILKPVTSTRIVHYHSEPIVHYLHSRHYHHEPLHHHHLHNHHHETHEDFVHHHDHHHDHIHDAHDWPH